ncbi:uncharacterized protein LOC142150012 [Mixophyes fleayi]|uniref:uncharacterized protein LOC142150012 n=1 Tax=Mixophyes fleayi TaxID=3061075 RepID=UPI003F4E1215
MDKTENVEENENKSNTENEEDINVDGLKVSIIPMEKEEEEVMKDNNKDEKLSSDQENYTTPIGKEKDIGEEEEVMKVNEEEDDVFDGQMENTLPLVIENNIKEEEEAMKGNEELFISEEKEAPLLEKERDVEEQEEIIKGQEDEGKVPNSHISRIHKTMAQLRRFFRRRSATVSPQDNTYDDSIADIVESQSKQQSGRIHHLFERLHKIRQNMDLCHRNTEDSE